MFEAAQVFHAGWHSGLSKRTCARLVLGLQLHSYKALIDVAYSIILQQHYLCYMRMNSCNSEAARTKVRLLLCQMGRCAQHAEIQRLPEL